MVKGSGRYWGGILLVGMLSSSLFTARMPAVQAAPASVSIQVENDLNQDPQLISGSVSILKMNEKPKPGLPNAGPVTSGVDDFSIEIRPNKPLQSVSSIDPQPVFPIRAAFYYPWFPEAWTQRHTTPYTNFTPSLGLYSAYDLATIQRHIAAMQYGHIQAGIASWWGQGKHTDVKFPQLLAAAAGTSFRWAIYYEGESQGNPSPTQISEDLTYINDHYGHDPAYLRVDGRPVIFVYAAPGDACGMAQRWKEGNTQNNYIMLKVFPGYERCPDQPDSWHQYAPAKAENPLDTYSYAISPGFWLKGTGVRLQRDPERWLTNVKSMLASGAEWQLVTTFNEWGEGTSVEPALEWSSPSGYGVYLDVLHNNGESLISPKGNVLRRQDSIPENP